MGDCREVLRGLPKGGVQCCVTSPPYWGLRDYGVKRQIGLEKTPEEFIDTMIEVFSVVREVLADDGTLWLNLGDSYATGSGGSNAPRQRDLPKAPAGWAARNHPTLQRTAVGTIKPKDLCGMPWRVAFALQADGWYLRSDIIWHKPNPMPESVTDRPTKSHEYVFLMSKSPRYFCDMEAIKEQAVRAGAIPGGNNSRGIGEFGVVPHAPFNGPVPSHRNRRTVWTIATAPFPGAHFATFPPKLVEPCILAGSRPGDVVLDPFLGAGTTAMVAEQLGREWIGIELNPKYSRLAREAA